MREVELINEETWKKVKNVKSEKYLKGCEHFFKTLPLYFQLTYLTPNMLK